MDDNKTIYTSDGQPIQWLPKDVMNHLDKTTLIFGGTGSGKTTIIEEILYLIKDYVPNVLVIAPKTSDVAYRQKLPSRCIKEDLTKEKLQQIWQRQVFVTQIYNIANDINVLESLFTMAPDRMSLLMIEMVKRKAADMIRTVESSTYDFGKKKAQKEAIEELQLKRIKSIYKDAVKKNMHILENMVSQMNDQQRTAIEYIDLNPRFTLIIDDSTEKFQVWMKYFKKGEINPFECIFYKNRWNFLTLIIAAHDDKYINTELRKNARVTIYTNSQALVTSVERKSNGFTMKEKKQSMAYATRIFGSDDDPNTASDIKTHQKMCYVREDARPFKYTIANKYPEFNLGCAPLRNLVEKMPKKDDNLAANPFVKNLIATKKSQTRRPL